MRLSIAILTLATCAPAQFQQSQWRTNTDQVRAFTNVVAAGPQVVFSITPTNITILLTNLDSTLADVFVKKTGDTLTGIITNNSSFITLGSLITSNSIFHNAWNISSSGAPGNSIVFSEATNSSSAAVIGYNFVSSTRFVGSGSNLTDIAADNISGGATTNLVVDGYTLYFTNGILRRTSIP